MKIKLEQTLDELEDALERERRSKLEQEKQRKKVENDLRVAQENVYIAERCKSDHNEVICKKNKEITWLEIFCYLTEILNFDSMKLTLRLK